MRRIALLVGVAALATLVDAPAGATVRCVKVGGGGSCTATISAALTAAGPGDTIRVVAGTYVEYVVIDKNVTLEGGWDSAFTARDPVANATTIEPPDSSNSVVSIAGTFGNASASTPVLDGFTITGGGGGPSGSGGNHGGGLRIQDSFATVRNCTLTGNRGYLFGGGVWIQRGQVTLERDHITDNVMPSDGGEGGGLEIEDATALLVDDEIENNSITGSAGSGGGIYADSRSTLFVIRGSINGNSAGPACSGTGGGISAGYLLLRSASVIGNCAATYDSVYSSYANLYGSLFVSKPPSTAAAMVHLDNASGGGFVENCTFAREGGLTPAAVEFSALEGALDYHADDSLFLNTMPVGLAFGYLQGTANVFWNGAVAGAQTTLLSYVEEDPLLDASYHLTPGSPLVDAGVRGTLFEDVDGEPRPAKGGSGYYRFDIGADELRGPAQRVAIPSPGGQAPDLTVIGPGNPPENPNSNGNNDWIGFSVLAADVSGDGLDDLVFSAQDWAEDFDTLNATGRVFGLRHFGTRRTGVLDMRNEPADFQVRCELELQHLGQELVSGDVNGDGHGDLVIGSSDTHMLTLSTPTVAALFGGSSLAQNGAVIDVGSLGDFAVRAPDSDSLVFATHRGLAVGDLDGDGIDDIAIGDRLADDGTNLGVGAVYVFFGSPTLHGVRNLDVGAADFTLFGPATTDSSFAANPKGGIAIGDVNHDGKLDLVARDSTRAYVLFGPLAPGARHLATQSTDLLVQGLAAGGVIAMDMTGDGVDDLVLDASGDAEGTGGGAMSAIHVIPGPLSAGAIPSAEAAAAYTLTDVTLDGGPAESLAAGDVAGDPRKELLVGAPDAVYGGLAFAVSPGLYGPGMVSILDTASVVVQAGDAQTYKRLGFDVAGGDLDGDGRADLVVGTWQADDPAAAQAKDQDVGRVLVYYGDACGNGRLNAGEACDDAKPVDGDGCSFDCRVETDYACVGEPSACGFDVSRLTVSSVAGAASTSLGGSASIGASLESMLALAHAGLGLEFWLSGDTSFDAGQDREVGGCALSQLASGGTQSCNTNADVPANLPLVGGQPTAYHWFACVSTAAGRSCTLGNTVTVPEANAVAEALAALSGLAAVARRRAARAGCARSRSI